MNEKMIEQSQLFGRMESKLDIAEVNIINEINKLIQSIDKNIKVK